MEIRRVTHTTDAIESLNMRPRESIKARCYSPDDESAIKPL